jgi:hypothetical protein
MRSKTLPNGGDFAITTPLLMLLIQREQREKLIITLSGRIGVENIAELQRVLDLETSGSEAVALDLNEVLLVDREAIRFLAGCEAKCIAIETPPIYIREWITAHKRQSQQREDCHEFEPSVQSASNSAPQPQ